MNRDLNIDDKIFDEAINFLLKQGFNSSYPIISTGGYILYILERNSDIISFKKYITQEKLTELWPYAVKRTYDYSMSPNGIIYSNWSETEEYTKKKTL